MRGNAPQGKAHGGNNGINRRLSLLIDEIGQGCGKGVCTALVFVDFLERLGKNWNDVGSMCLDGMYQAVYKICVA